MTPTEMQETDKGVLRRAMLLHLQDMTADERMARSEKICARVAESDEWKRAERLVLFSPFRTEPAIASLQTAAVAGGREVLVIPQTLRDESELALRFVPDFILVPGLAFTKQCQRLGRGSGFYDRLLAGRAAGAFKMGVCFALQLRDRIPQNEHDVVLHAVISD